MVILEAKLTFQERAWYIQAARQFGWSKVELQQKIIANAHMEIVLDFTGEVCYTEENTASLEYTADDAHPFYLSREYRNRISESIDISGFAGLASRFDTDLTHDRRIRV